MKARNKFLVKRVWTAHKIMREYCQEPLGRGSMRSLVARILNPVWEEETGSGSYDGVSLVGDDEHLVRDWEDRFSTAAKVIKFIETEQEARNIKT